MHLLHVSDTFIDARSAVRVQVAVGESNKPPTHAKK